MNSWLLEQLLFWIIYWIRTIAFSNNWPFEQLLFRKIDSIRTIDHSKNCFFLKLTGYPVRYGSPLLPRLNVIVNRLTEAGITEQWRTFTLHSMSIKGNVYQEKKASKWRKLTLTNLITIFRFVVGGWIVSTAVMFLEVIYYSYNGMKK